MNGFANIRPWTAEDVVGGAGRAFAGVKAEGNVEVAGGDDVAVVGCEAIGRGDSTAEGGFSAEKVDAAGYAMNRLKERRHILASLFVVCSGR